LEITATVTLLAGSALVASRIADLMTTEFGFDVERLQMASLRPVGSEYRGRDLARVYDDVMTRLRERTGMQAALIDRVPLDYWRAQPVQVNRGTESGVRAGVRAMSAGALAVVGAELVAGREFRDGDRDGAPRVAVINESLAARLPGGVQSALGTTVSVTWRAEQHELQVVGVVRDLRDSVYRPAGPELYVSASQFPQPRATFIVRSDRSPEELGTALRQALRDVDPRQAISDVVMVSDRVRTYTALSRFVGIVLVVFAALAILLAATGVLASVAGAVANRTRELGIRIAVGASRRDILISVSRDFVPAFLTGVAAGTLATWGASSVLRSLVPGVALVDPAAFAAASTGIIVVAVAGAWWPVRRALAIDPVIVLAAPEEW
jgi:ABC-type antimicrobial peptide transport system permease subunit